MYDSVNVGGKIQMIETIDDTLEHHNAELVDMTIRNLSWKYDYNSTGNGVNKHWTGTYSVDIHQRSVKKTVMNICC